MARLIESETPQMVNLPILDNASFSQWIMMNCESYDCRWSTTSIASCCIPIGCVGTCPYLSPSVCSDWHGVACHGVPWGTSKRGWKDQILNSTKNWYYTNHGIQWASQSKGPIRSRPKVPRFDTFLAILATGRIPILTYNDMNDIPMINDNPSAKC